ncbi:HAD-IA family hydrolase [Nocardiopsis sp. NRRL B-16309]|uniref:HAD-IA family hydrolase n=1 Tax=Nocardiopsis sp. NRRL B-16309 TaxID=1519494 RepID=UPI0006ADADC4|nr:HAD-IA family hydrolase [Nocardiopsis sp. NRRL B-16309]KOX22079.1 HAD family hydrolase [Nocardiopsis sp. NRRL B-16309]
MAEFGEATVLFDLDGVLVDSETAVREGLLAWARERDLDPARVLGHSHGRTNAGLVALVAPHLDPEAEDLVIEGHEAERGDTVRAMPGAHDLLAALRGRGRPWAVVTSGSRRIATARIAAAGLPLPGVLVTADDVTEGKPHPEPYLLGAERVGAAPSACVVVEDSPGGARAGLAAGMPVVAVASTTAREHLAHATTVVDDLSDVARLLV